MTPKSPAGLAACLALGLSAGAALAQDQAPRQSDAAPPTAETPPAAAGAAPRVLTMPPAAEAAAPETPRAEPAANPSARFQFVRIGEAILKLDGDTGAVGFCRAHGTDWSCQALPEEHAARDQEIGRLQQRIDDLGDAVGPVTGETRALKDSVEALRAEVGTLKTGIGALKDETASIKAGLGVLTNDVGAIRLAVFPPPPPPPPPAPESKSFELRMPTAEDYARARALAVDAVSDAWRKLVAMVAQVQFRVQSQVQSEVMRKS
jgi:hypothetical protein